MKMGPIPFIIFKSHFISLNIMNSLNIKLFYISNYNQTLKIIFSINTIIMIKLLTSIVKQKFLFYDLHYILGTSHTCNIISNTYNN